MIQVLGGEQLIKNISAYGKDIVQAVTDACQITQALIINDARSDHPYTDRSGNLTQSIQPGAIEISDDEVSAYVEARMQYASFVEFGTSRAKAYPFLTPAMLRNAANFRKNLARQIKSIR